MITESHIVAAVTALKQLQSERPDQLHDGGAVRGWLLDHRIEPKALVTVLSAAAKLRQVTDLSAAAAGLAAFSRARSALVEEGYADLAVDATLEVLRRMGGGRASWPPSGAGAAGQSAPIPAPPGVRVADIATPSSLRSLSTWCMLRIPAGTFTMGSSHESDNQPHQVTISRAFEIGKFPVTQEVYAAVMNGAAPSDFKGARRPVEQVSWEDALKFCDALSKAAGFKPVYGGTGVPAKVDWSATGYRLPTEAEWEYACRAGSTGETYGELDRIAWYAGNSGWQTHDVGGKAANAWGLHDTLGNVWEWCWDVYSSSTPAGGTDPRGATSGSSGRVYRGGSWSRGAGNCLAAFRHFNVPSHRYLNRGFRLCRTAA